MNIVMLSRTALAGAPFEAMKCLNKYTDLNVRWIALKTDYNDGRVFPKDLLWLQDKDECLNVLEAADVIHVHNEEFPLPEEFKKKPRLIQFHSVPIRPTIMEQMRKEKHKYGLMQPLQIQHYPKYFNNLPNMLDPEEYMPIERTDNKIIISFAPTNKLPNNVPGSKGANDVVNILTRLNNRCKNIELQLFSNMEYYSNLEAKQRSHILIDDVTSMTWHKTSLEGCCFGCCVVTGYQEPGFVFSNLNFLEETLFNIVNNKALLHKCMTNSRQWLLEKWHPKDKVKHFVDAYNKVLNG